MLGHTTIAACAGFIEWDPADGVLLDWRGVVDVDLLTDRCPRIYQKASREGAQSHLRPALHRANLLDLASYDEKQLPTHMRVVGVDSRAALEAQRA